MNTQYRKATGGLTMRLKLFRWAFILVASFGMSATGWAADGSWSSTGSGAWSNSGNWAGGTIAGGSGSTASFTNAVGADVTVTNDFATWTIGNLQFGHSANGNSYNWTITTNNALELAGGTPTVTVNTNSATVALVIWGSSGLIKNGPGTLILKGQNLFSGLLTVREGVLALAGQNKWCTGYGQTEVLTNGVLRWDTLNCIMDDKQVMLRGGTANLQGFSEYFGGLTLSSNALFTGSAGNWFILNGTSPGEVTTEGVGSAGTIAASMAVASQWGGFSGNRTQSFNIAAGTSLTVSGAIVNDNSSGGMIGSVLKTGAGTLTLSAANTYSGGTLVSNGVIIVGNDLAFGTNLVTLAGGGLSVTNVTRVTTNLFNLIQDATFDVQTGADWASMGTITNSGKLVKTGGGVLTIPLMGACKVVVGGGTLKLSAPIPAGTVACYTFNNPSALGEDSSTNANTLVTATGTPAYTNSGRNGGALYLDGISTMNKSGVFPAGIPTNNSPYTIALWEKDNGSADKGGFVGWGNNANNQCNNLRFNGANQLVNYWYGNDWILTGLTTNPKDGAWHHLAVTWDGATQTMFVDGKSVGTSSRTGLNAAAANFVVGKTTADTNFTGWIDDLLIANRALSSNELVSLSYNVGIPQNVTNDSVRIDAGCVLDLSGSSQTFASLSGSGAVTGGTLTVTSSLMPGETNAVGTLAITNLVMAANSTYYWDYGTSSSDAITVAGVLSLPNVATVNVNRVSGSLPNPAVLFTFESGAGSGATDTNLTSWVITGAMSNTRAVVRNKQVQLLTATGLMLEIY